MSRPSLSDQHRKFLLSRVGVILAPCPYIYIYGTMEQRGVNCLKSLINQGLALFRRPGTIWNKRNNACYLTGGKKFVMLGPSITKNAEILRSNVLTPVNASRCHIAWCSHIGNYHQLALDVAAPKRYAVQHTGGRQQKSPRKAGW